MLCNVKHRFGNYNLSGAIRCIWLAGLLDHDKAQMRVKMKMGEKKKNEEHQKPTLPDLLLLNFPDTHPVGEDGVGSGRCHCCCEDCTVTTR